MEIPIFKILKKKKKIELHTTMEEFIDDLKHLTSPPHHNKYEIIDIEKPIGAGGHGCVFLARDTETDAKVAVKIQVIKPDILPEDQDAMLSEIVMMKGLNHPKCYRTFG